MVLPPQTDGLCSGDGVIIQTVSSDPAPSDPLGQTQLIVETDGQSKEDPLGTASLLEGSETVVTETQELVTERFPEKVRKPRCPVSSPPEDSRLQRQCQCIFQGLSPPSVEAPEVHSGIPPSSSVLIVSPPNISSTLTGKKVFFTFKRNILNE